MTRLPEGVKLLRQPTSNYDVVLNGAAIGTVYQRAKTYNIHPKAFTMRWWEARLAGAHYPLGVSTLRLAQGESIRDQTTKFDTRTQAIDALVLLASPPSIATDAEIHV
jgi:hypothetical protein